MPRAGKPWGSKKYAHGTLLAPAQLEAGLTLWLGLCWDKPPARCAWHRRTVPSPPRFQNADPTAASAPGAALMPQACRWRWRLTPPAVAGWRISTVTCLVAAHEVAALPVGPPAQHARTGLRKYSSSGGHAASASRCRTGAQGTGCARQGSGMSRCQCASEAAPRTRARACATFSHPHKPPSGAAQRQLGFGCTYLHCKAGGACRRRGAHQAAPAKSRPRQACSANKLASPG